ncbi:hypothetical protein GCM10010339_18780 [Streptomyces alanosinicus]|uniref:Uncharacterized protein n=1 Tax=Streptomyces alanosinicus TaxID=68171 RepID=A0A918YFF9_9ACTN|nr:hypothetical protein GCM10010339_18780 [Streptomyces alanosinicus]
MSIVRKAAVDAMDTGWTRLSMTMPPKRAVLLGGGATAASALAAPARMGAREVAACVRGAARAEEMLSAPLVVSACWCIRRRCRWRW